MVGKDYVRLHTGTAISIRAEHRKLPMQLARNGCVLVYFSNDDVDFKIVVDNSRYERELICEIVINEENNSYYILPEQNIVLSALTDLGRKLHFKCQATKEGRDMVQKTAEKYNISYEKASDSCSKIQMEISVAPKKGDNIEEPMNTAESNYSYDKRDGRSSMLFGAPPSYSNSGPLFGGTAVQEVYNKPEVKFGSTNTAKGFGSTNTAKGFGSTSFSREPGTNPSFSLASKEKKSTESLSSQSYPFVTRGAICFGGPSGQRFQKVSLPIIDFKIPKITFLLCLRHTPQYIPV